MGQRVGRVSSRVVSSFVAVAELLWISWDVLGGAGFFCVFFPLFFSFECTRPAACMRSPCLIYISTSIDYREACGS